MNQTTRLKPLFRPGRLLITPVALTALRANGIPVISVVLKHIAGDWGIVSDEDRQQNDLSIRAGLRLISLYRLPDQTRILVLTEWDRSNTTIERLEDVVSDSGGRQKRPASRRYPAWPSASYVQGGCA
ncbi:plasmid related protein [Burkholderia pseudomallei]|nr:plasmid related protein [Burkholderia pseudomallei]CAJ4640893.1 plasmid related protein [Burkholderia pseudomallei]CAJ7299477.1 plasmid related protein [Burkholderia pseudomallei]